MADSECKRLLPAVIVDAQTTIGVNCWCKWTKMGTVVEPNFNSGEADDGLLFCSPRSFPSGY
jgi:hypothetical protein